MVRYTDRAWWTVDDAAQLLRVNRKTLYDACAAGDFPHDRIGPYIKIPAEALMLTVRPQTQTRTYHVTDDPWQLELPLGPIVPVRRYRNGEVRRIGDYEVHLSTAPFRWLPDGTRDPRFKG